MTTLKQYIVKETDLLKQLCDIVQKDEIKDKLSANTNKTIKHTPIKNKFKKLKKLSQIILR